MRQRPDRSGTSCREATRLLTQIAAVDLSADCSAIAYQATDETTAPVLDPGRGKTKTGHLWTLARDDRRWGGPDPPGVVYFYAPGRGGGHAEVFLDGFDGILQIDGYAGYNRLTRPSRKGGDPVSVAHCWAHANRKLREVFEREGLERIAYNEIVEIFIPILNPLGAEFMRCIL